MRDHALFSRAQSLTVYVSRVSCSAAAYTDLAHTETIHTVDRSTNPSKVQKIYCIVMKKNGDRKLQLSAGAVYEFDVDCSVFKFGEEGLR